VQGNWTRKQADKVERVLRKLVRSFVWTRPKPGVVAVESELGLAMTLFDENNADDLALAVRSLTLEACDAGVYREKDRLVG